MSVDLLVAPSDELDAAVRAELAGLWRAAFDDFAPEDEEHAYGGVHVLAREGDAWVGHASAVPRTIHVGERSFAAGYVEAVATRPDRQGRGIGTAVMRELGRLIEERFELGVLSTDAHEFYQRLGWERWRGPSYVLRDGERVRTPDEDDGLMVLRLGPSAGVDLTGPIACPDRAGDAW